jgi:hypothetical protein
LFMLRHRAAGGTGIRHALQKNTRRLRYIRGEKGQRAAVGIVATIAREGTASRGSASA